MTLAHESLDLTRTEGQRLVVYMAAPGTADYDAMVLLDMASTAGAATDESAHDSGLPDHRYRVSFRGNVSLPWYHRTQDQRSFLPNDPG